MLIFQMRLRISIRGRDHPSVGPSVHPSVRPSVRLSDRLYVPCYFQMMNVAIFEIKNSSNDIKNSDTMTDDGVVASDVAPWYLVA